MNTKKTLEYNVKTPKRWKNTNIV